MNKFPIQCQNIEYFSVYVCYYITDKLFTSWSMGWAVEVNKKRSEKDYISHIHNISAWVNSKNIPLMNIIGKYSRLNKNIIMYKRNLCFALPYIARWVEGCIYRRRGIMQILSSVLWSKFTLLSTVFMKHC